MIPQFNDVDCVLLVDPEFPTDMEAEAELLAGLPFLEIVVVKQSVFDRMTLSFFASDRSLKPIRVDRGRPMNLQSRQEVRNTQAKLAMLEETRREVHASGGLTRADELTLSSLDRLINQLKEEIAVYEAHHSTVKRN